MVSDCTRVPRLVTLPPEPTLQPVEELRQRVRDITRQRVQREEAEGRLNRALQQIGYTQADLQAAELILGTASLPDLQGSKAELAVLQSQSDAAHRQWRELHDKCTDAQRQADLVQSKFAAALSTEASASKRITDIRADLDALAFGNGLMKKLRLLKPTVTDHLWSLTLTTVSAYFGQIRGETSIVTKDSSGFQVNGEPLSSYSGSTKDALAIAIRAALTKTFLPGAAFMTLDEPAHGASEDRTGRILAFLAHVGIDQVVIASHDPLSESVADNLIYL